MFLKFGRTWSRSDIDAAVGDEVRRSAELLLEFLNIRQADELLTTIQRVSLNGQDTLLYHPPNLCVANTKTSSCLSHGNGLSHLEAREDLPQFGQIDIPSLDAGGCVLGVEAPVHQAHKCLSGDL